MFALVDFAARKGLADKSAVATAKQPARRTGIRGETYAYSYLRHHGYTLVARNLTAPGIKGEIDMVGCDGPPLAFIELKTRATPAPEQRPEDAVNWEKRRNLTRMARQSLRARRLHSAACRFDVLAIETRSGAKPIVRVHKAASAADGK